MSSYKVHDPEREDGFTLIELLVVVIIIGILAAIAIPTFLSQRERGWQAELTSAVRNAALEVEAVATQNVGNYPTVGANAGQITAATLGDFFQRAGTATNMGYVYTVDTTANTFLICGQHPQINGGVNNVAYNSNAGGVQPYAEANCAGTLVTPAKP